MKKSKLKLNFNKFLAIIELVLLAGASVFGWVIARKYRNINLTQRNKKESEVEILETEELYYKEEELDDVPSQLRELLDCSVDLCSIRSPVTSPNGITFEKNSIVEWLKRKNLCPVTKQDLSLTDLRFNRNIFNLINFLTLRDRYNRRHPHNPIKINEIL